MDKQDIGQKQLSKKTPRTYSTDIEIVIIAIIVLYVAGLILHYSNANDGTQEVVVDNYSVDIKANPLPATVSSNDSENKQALEINIPDTMSIGQASQARVRIKLGRIDAFMYKTENGNYFQDLDATELKAVEDYFSTDPKNAGTERSSYAFVDLIAAPDDFSLAPTFMVQDQLVKPDAYSVWEWGIVPRQAGMLNLKVNVTTKTKKEDEIETREYKIFEKRIFVRPNDLN